MSKFKITKKAVNRVHRLLGIFVGIFLIHLSITGIFLNHTEDLSLDETFIKSSWLMSLYNLSPPSISQSFLIKNQLILKAGDQIFLEAKPIFTTDISIKGVVESNEMIIVALESELIFFTSSGELIEKIGGSAEVPTNIKRLGKDSNTIYIQADNDYWIFDEVQLTFIKVNIENIENKIAWSNEGVVSPDAKSNFNQYYYGKGVSVEQFFLDLHNGNIINFAGKWILDIIGLLLLALSLSGFWIWLKRKR